MSTTAAQVIALAEEISGCEATPDSLLVDDLGLDSLDLVQLAIDVEDRFNIRVPDEAVDNPELGSVRGLIAYVEGQLRPGREL